MPAELIDGIVHLLVNPEAVHMSEKSPLLILTGRSYLEVRQMARRAFRRQLATCGLPVIRNRSASTKQAIERYRLEDWVEPQSNTSRGTVGHLGGKHNGVEGTILRYVFARNRSACL